MWKSLLLFITCFVYFIHSKLIITDFHYHYTKNGVVLRCLYDNGAVDKNDSVQFFVNNTLLYSFDPKATGQQTLQTVIDGVQLDSENSNSTHLALKQIERQISGMFRCEVKSRKTIEKTKVERKFVFDFPGIGYSRRLNLRREQLEAIQAQSTKTSYKTPFGQSNGWTQHIDDTNENYYHWIPTDRRMVGQRGVRLTDHSKLTNSEINNLKLMLINRSAEQQRTAAEKRNVNYHVEQLGSDSRKVNGERDKLALGDHFNQRVKIEKPNDLSPVSNKHKMNMQMNRQMNGKRFASPPYDTLKPVSPVLRSFDNLIWTNSQEPDIRTRRQPRTDRLHDLNESQETALIQDELESSKEIIKKEYLDYWTRINLIKLFSEIANIKRHIGMQPVIYLDRIQP